MFGKLLRLLKKEPKLGRMRRRKIERWDLIGTVDRDGERLERVPNWVLEQIERIRQDEWEHSQKFMNHYLRGKTYRYKLEFSFAASPYLCVYRSRQRRERRRATVLAIRDDRLLLVMHVGDSRYKLPGGGVRRGEPSMAAAARELYAKSGLTCSKIEWQFTYEGRTRSHHVCRVTPEGHPSLKDGEVSQFLWWNPNHDLKNIPVETHVAEILGKVDWPD